MFQNECIIMGGAVKREKIILYNHSSLIHCSRSFRKFRMGKTDLAVKCADFDFRLAVCAIFRPLAWGFSGMKRSETFVV